MRRPEHRGRPGPAGAAACRRRRTASLRLSSARHPARTRGHGHESQEAVPAVPRGGPGDSAPAWPQARDRNKGTLALPQAPDRRWSLDFVSDCLAARGFRILLVVNDFTRECVAVFQRSPTQNCQVGSLSASNWSTPEEPWVVTLGASSIASDREGAGWIVCIIQTDDQSKSGGSLEAKSVDPTSALRAAQSTLPSLLRKLRHKPFSVRSEAR
jgi:hypothetical protein